MKRQASPQLAARRREVVSLTHTTEHYAALVAEHEQDPYLHKQWLQETERENSTARDATEGLPVAPGQQLIFPGNTPADDSCAGRSP